MNQKGLVSIIMTVYNTEAYLSLPLNSLLQQTSKDFELVIVDDASTDNSDEIIQQFIQEHPQIPTQYLKMPENKGQGAALNLGMSHANGEFLCIIDSDDEVSPDFIRLLKEKIQNSLDFVYCGFDVIHPHENRVDKYEDYRDYSDDSKTIINQYMKAKTYFTYVGAIYRKSFLEEHQIKFYEPSRYGYDIEFMCNLLLYEPRCGCVDQSLYYYIKRPTSITMVKDSPYALHPIEGMARVQKKLPTFRQRVKFAFFKKANVIFYTIKDLYRKKSKKNLPFSQKLSYTIYFLFQFFLQPSKNMNRFNLKAIVYFNF